MTGQRTWSDFIPLWGLFYGPRGFLEDILCAPEEKRVLSGRLKNSVEKCEVLLVFSVVCSSCFLPDPQPHYSAHYWKWSIKVSNSYYLNVFPFSSVGFASCIFWLCFWCIYYVFLISLSLRILFILNPIYLSEMSIVTPAVFILGILKKKKPPGLIWCAVRIGCPCSWKINKKLKIDVLSLKSAQGYREIISMGLCESCDWCWKHHRNLWMPQWKPFLEQDLGWVKYCYFGNRCFQVTSWQTENVLLLNLSGKPEATSLSVLFFFFFFNFWPCHFVCRILVSPPGIEPTPPALEVWSLNHWTTREGPSMCPAVPCWHSPTKDYTCCAWVKVLLSVGVTPHLTLTS